MTVYVQGQNATRDVEWREYPPNGPLIDVLNVMLTIENLATGVVSIGPTSIGVTHPATGRNVYTWAIPANQVPGQYLWTWDAFDPVVTGSPVVATEIIEIASSGTGDGVTGPCEPWTPIWGACNLTCGPTVTGDAVAAATEVLVALSGQRFGFCTTTIRPCRRDCYGNSWPWGGTWVEYGTWPRPLFFNGQWYNIVCGGCESDCSCSVLSEVKLPRSVHDIIEVKVDGVVLLPSDYDLQYTSAGPVLVRLGGEFWPVCNNFALDDDQAGTWSITARYGEAPTTLGQLAVGELSCQLAKAMCNDASCQLPPNAQSIVRQGITIELLDPNTIFESGLTGLRLTDRFIKTYNPNGLQERTKVYDIDGPSFRLTGR